MIKGSKGFAIRFNRAEHKHFHVSDPGASPIGSTTMKTRGQPSSQHAAQSSYFATCRREPRCPTAERGCLEIEINLLVGAIRLN
jgi:hypothetical protein